MERQLIVIDSTTLRWPPLGYDKAFNKVGAWKDDPYKLPQHLLFFYDKIVPRCFEHITRFRVTSFILMDRLLSHLPKTITRHFGELNQNLHFWLNLTVTSACFCRAY